MPQAKCDECKKPVEQYILDRSAKAFNGLIVGPWLCQSCEKRNTEFIQQGFIRYLHDQAVQDNRFDTMCNEADPQLAEAIHRAKRAKL